ncbi:MAG: glycosyltransferase [Candidatus Omnitrophica bacterium]|nr:glycosyltransferase [Candidatus Omnitrophota bacterium]
MQGADNAKNFISVVICTFNRCAELDGALKSLLKLECDSSFDYEIIVVDNNSKDDTKKMVESYMAQFHGRLKYVLEAKQGLSNARNRGIRESRGNIIAYVDDDCIIEAEWLIYLDKTFKKYDADLVGGKILPLWLKKPSKWIFRKYIMGKLSLLDYGDNEFHVTKKEEEPYGANMAFKKSSLIESGLFKGELGRTGNNLFAGEETELFLQFLNNGKRIYYQPKAVVHHKVLPMRMKKSYFRNRCFDGGRTKVLMEKSAVNYATFFKIPKFLFKDLITSAGRYLWALIRFNGEMIFFQELDICYVLGRMYEYRKRNNTVL